MADIHKHSVELVEDVAQHESDSDTPSVVSDAIKQEHHDLYVEALRRYPNDAAIDPADEKRLVRKLDRRIIPLLGICYFFYYVDKTTLSYAAIFGIKDDLALKGTQYSWLSSIFYFGWLIWYEDQMCCIHIV